MRFNISAVALLSVLATTAHAAPLGKSTTGEGVNIWTPAKNMLARLPNFSLFNFRREPEQEDIFGARDLEDTEYLAVRDLPPNVLRSEIPLPPERREELQGEVVYRSIEEIEARDVADFVEMALNRRAWA